MSNPPLPDDGPASRDDHDSNERDETEVSMHRALLTAICINKGLSSIMSAAVKKNPPNSHATFTEQLEEFDKAVELLNALGFHRPSTELDLNNYKDFTLPGDGGSIRLSVHDVLAGIEWTESTFMKKTRIYPWIETAAARPWGEEVPRKWLLTRVKFALSHIRSFFKKRKVVRLGKST